MQSLIATSLFLAILLVSSITAQQRELEHERPPSTGRRVALVIGNSDYVVGQLRNPVNDARAMTQALRELGFEVMHREDLGQTDMRRSINEFGERIKRRGGVGLFYYAGHGVQVKGENYLIPVNAVPGNAEEVKYETISARLVLSQMAAAGNGINIVVLDACRNNPFARTFRSTSEGLAAINAPSGTLIAYATAPGSVASDGGKAGNGIYTQELLKMMRVPGLSIEEVFKRVRVAVRQRTQDRQTPWEESSLTGDFYFIPAQASDGGSSAAREPDSPATAAGAKTFAGTSIDIGQGDVYSNVQLAGYNNETVLIFSVRHIHEISWRGGGCNGLLYVTPTRIVFEAADQKHSLDMPRNQLREVKAGNLSFSVTTPHLVLSYGDETKRFHYHCKNKKKGGKGGACNFPIPFADYLFNLTAIDFDAAIRKFQVYARTKG